MSTDRMVPTERCTSILLFTAIGSTAQSVAPHTTTNVAGGYYNNQSSYYRFEWSLGEISLVQTFSPADSSLYITQGLLQPVTEFSQLSPYIVFFGKDEYRLFPNPTPGRFEVNFKVRQSGWLELQLTDVLGNVLQKKALRYLGWGHIEHYDLSKVQYGTYFVVATLTPDTLRPGDFATVVRRSAFRVVKF